MHDWRRDGDEIGGGSDGSRGSRDFCRWRRRGRFGAFAPFLLDCCGEK